MGAAVAGASLLLIPGAALGHGLVWLTAYQIVFTPAATVWGVALVTLRQSVATPETLASVTAFAQTALVATIPVGSALAGLLASRIGVTTTLTVLAALATGSFLMYVGSGLWAAVPVNLRGRKSPGSSPTRP